MRDIILFFINIICWSVFSYSLGYAEGKYVTIKKLRRFVNRANSSDRIRITEELMLQGDKTIFKNKLN